MVPTESWTTSDYRATYKRFRHITALSVLHWIRHRSFGESCARSRIRDREPDTSLATADGCSSHSKR